MNLEFAKQTHISRLAKLSVISVYGVKLGSESYYPHQTNNAGLSPCVICFMQTFDLNLQIRKDLLICATHTFGCQKKVERKLGDVLLSSLPVTQNIERIQSILIFHA